MNKVAKYTIISFLLLLGLCCVGVLYLFFVPNSSLFTITYINSNKEVKSLTYDVNSVDEIRLISRAYDVNILPTESSVVYAEVSGHSFGFVQVKNKEVNITSSLKNKILTFKIDEPFGFASQNNSYINLYIPNGFSPDLTLKNKKAITTINSEVIQINNLTYSTEKGQFDFESGTINGELNLVVDEGIFTIGKNVVTNSNDVNLKITEGKFMAKYSSFGDLTFTGNKRGVISIKECKILTHNNENLYNAGGQIYADTVFQIYLKSRDTKVNIKTVLNGSDIDLTGGGSVNIDSLTNYSSITTNKGNIIVKNCESNALFHSDSGNINVKNAKKLIRVITRYGNASVTFSDDADHYDGSNNARVLYASVHNGTLTAKGVEHIGASDGNVTPENIRGIDITGNGSVTITMNDVIGSNIVTGNRGNVKMIINNTSKYILTTSSSSGSVRVNLLQISDYMGYTTKLSTVTKVNCSSSTNTLNVSTSTGALTLLDDVIYENGF